MCGRILLPILGTGVAIYGLIVFTQRNFLTYMLVRTQFVFLDFGESIPLFYLDSFAMIGTFLFLGYYISMLLAGNCQEKEPAKRDEEMLNGQGIPDFIRAVKFVLEKGA